ncbi:NAD-dependent epimerase/dehydratase family protein [Desulfovibrio litoralis]|uniref:UDP-glucose 4-epimerase n=1 Tax=Desulfovibrio litoralis DSM 11393 TaxID=1121455 RepID=A0A1M7SFW3_9BACT|nr:NAD-dependent epimerase/dehydratase family protein [Desulfovibrio litoralis]SHN57202.1 UDP-glucose 4-epimerase [Desulfovibrio litoralis DSM 11393]
MSKYLVTGVAGFIGSAVANALLAQGHEVVGIDNMTTGSPENVSSKITFFQADCQDPSLYASKLPKQKYDAIFHIAGQSSGEISFDDPSYDLRTNTESTLHLLKFGLANDCKRFIYASTMSVYGMQPDKEIDESSSTFPLSFYGVGKLASEHYLRLYEQFGMRSTALRLFNVYGTGQNMSNLRQGMVSIFMAMMLKDGKIHVKGSPERYRDFVYIDDVVNAFLLCLERESSAGQAINISGSGRTTVGSLIDKLVQLKGSESSSGKEIPVKFEGSTAGDMHGIYASQQKAEEILGYKPKFTLDSGLKRMYDWAKELKF